MKWIDIKDKSPDKGESWTDQLIVNVLHNGINHTTTANMYKGDWYWWSNRKIMTKDFVVTHWMKLPIPRKS